MAMKCFRRLATLGLGAAMLAGIGAARPAAAFEPFIGQLQFFPYNFVPRGWAFCDGQLLPISQNTALFSLLGVTFGGDGRSTFRLPDMRGRIPIHPGRGPGLTVRHGGEAGGSETVTLTIAEIPPHSHPVNASTKAGTAASPTGGVLARSRDQTYANVTPDVAMHADIVTPAGGNLPHENLPPFLVLNCNIALVGAYPSRP